METTLTPKNLQDLFDNISAQYGVLNNAHTTVFNSLRGYNIDMFSHFLGKPDADTQIPLVSSIVGFQRGVRDMAFSYSGLANYSQYRALFSALDTYFRSDTALVDKTINGFMAANNMKITDGTNAIYNGIMGRYIQARNLLVAPNRMIYKTTWNGSAFVTHSSSPTASEFNNTSYLATTVDGITYAPFPMKIVPTDGLANLVLNLTFSDNTTLTISNYSASAFPVGGYQIPTSQSGIKSVSATDNGIPLGSGFEVYADYSTMTFEWPVGWECYSNLDNGIQCYISSLSGQRIRLGSKYYFQKGATIPLYLRINPSVIGDIEGKFTVGATTLDYGTLADSWYVNTYNMTTQNNFSVTANAVPMVASIDYLFNDSYNTDLSNPANYSPPGTPTAIDTVTIAQGVQDGSEITGSVVCKSLTCDYQGYENGILISANITGDLYLNCLRSAYSGTLTGKGYFVGFCFNRGTIDEGDFSYSAENSGICGTGLFTNGALNNATGSVGSATFYGPSYDIGSCGSALYIDGAYHDGEGNVNSAVFESSSLDAISRNIAYISSGEFNGYSRNENFADTGTFRDNASNTAMSNNAFFYDSSVNEDSASIQNGTFYNGTTNYGEIASLGKFYGGSTHAGTKVCYTAEFYRTNTGTEESPIWLYPTVTSTASNGSATCNWPESDHTLEGTWSSITYA